MNWIWPKQTISFWSWINYYMEGPKRNTPGYRYRFYRMFGFEWEWTYENPNNH
jgi:hypothetical protein